MDLRIGSAGALVARRSPPVFIITKPVDPVVRYPALQPQYDALFVGLVHGDGAAFLFEAKVVQGELQGEVHRLGLEVVAETEISKHLEQRQVGSVANFVDVVGAKALLRGRHPFVGWNRLPSEIRLELDHAGGSKQKGWIPHGDQRRASGPSVVLAFEVLQEGFSKLGTFHFSHTSKLTVYMIPGITP